ncbi:MAG TPA: hypothetical protein VFO55_00625 [Gemmatimonadaceae bacterium]|nr:hypothetical protein [Gemmatimonadaceae bacterium]
MANAKELQATALAVITFLVRPSLFLLFGLIGGYALGFTDAFRESDTIGNKAARAIYRIHPAAVSEGIYQRASVIRDTLHRRSGIVDAPPPESPPVEIPPY